MTRVSFYTLTPFQESQLNLTANGDCVSVGIVESNAADSPEEKTKLDREVAEMNDLVLLGLFTNVSTMFSATIRNIREQHKRGFNVYSLTEQGLRMFHNAGKRPVN